MGNLLKKRKLPENKIQEKITEAISGLQMEAKVVQTSSASLSQTTTSTSIAHTYNADGGSDIEIRQGEDCLSVESGGVRALMDGVVRVWVSSQFTHTAQRWQGASLPTKNGARVVSLDLSTAYDRGSGASAAADHSPTSPAVCFNVSAGDLIGGALYRVTGNTGGGTLTLKGCMINVEFLL